MPISQILLTANSGGGGPFLSIYGYVSSMNEGSTNTVNVDYANYPPTTIYWQIVNDTTTNADWVTAEPNGMPLGDFYIEGTGTTSFSWTTAEDLTTEGDQTYYLNVGSALSGNDLFNGLFTVTDTSITPPTPTYTLTPDADNVDEGSTLTFNVGGTNIVNGTYYWTMETSAGDFGANNGLVTITNNEGSFTVTPDTDTTTEGAETFTVSLRADSIAGDILVTSDPVTINDTSLTPPEPTYTLTPAADNVDEGSSLTFTVGGTDVPDGTYYWTIETNAGDFSTGSGEVSVTNSSGSFTVTPYDDSTTEGAETFTVSLRSTSITGTILATSDSVTINDTSLDPPEPTYTLTALGSLASATSVDEGSSAAFEVGGTNIIDGTYYWTIESNSEDFATSNGEFSITSNTGSFFVVPTTDDTTEGEQTFTVSIRSVSITGTVLATSDPFTINDTSLTPEPTYEVTPAANNVDEGSSLEFTVSGTNITNGTYYWTIQDNISDFDTSSGEVTITDNAGSFTVTPSADATTEGSETFTVSLREGSIAGIILANSTSVTINDTSLDPEPPFSLQFNQPQGDYLSTPASTDWNLGTSWTIELVKRQQFR